MKFKHTLDLKMTEKYSVSSEKSTFKNLLLFIKTNVTAIFELGTCGVVDWSYTQYATEIDTQSFSH